jgi:ketosteroid isomerase-like protein
MLGTVLTIFISCAPKGEDPEKMVQAADELDKKFIEAYNDRDADALMETYWNSPDLVSFPPGKMETRGWEATKNAIEEEFANAPEFVLELTETNNVVVGDAVLGYGKWRFTISIPDADPMIMEGRFSDVKANRDGKWVYILDHASAPLPPPPPPEETEM